MLVDSIGSRNPAESPSSTTFPTQCRRRMPVANLILTGIEGIAFHYLTDVDVVRHRLVREIIKAYAADLEG